MTTSEREMVRPLDQHADKSAVTTERTTSLQPTYEDSVAPAPEDEWFDED
jgi:hypothetical protein